MNENYIILAVVIAVMGVYYLIEQMSTQKNQNWLARLSGMDSLMVDATQDTDDEPEQLSKLQSEVVDLRQRIIVLERIVTDSAYELNLEINTLKK